MAQRVKRLPARQETSVRSLAQEDPLEKWQPTPVLLPAWWATAHRLPKSWTWLEQFHFTNKNLGEQKHIIPSLFFLIFWASQVALAVKNLSASAGDAKRQGSIPGSVRSPAEGNGNLLQYPCLANPMHRGAWQATVHGGHKESETTSLLDYSVWEKWWDNCSRVTVLGCIRLS